MLKCAWFYLVVVQGYRWINRCQNTFISGKNLLVLGVQHLGLFHNTFVNDKGICIGFWDIVRPIGYRSKKSCAGCTIIGFVPRFEHPSSSSIKNWKETSIGNIRLSEFLPHCFSTLAEILDSLELIETIIFICSSKNTTHYSDTIVVLQ